MRWATWSSRLATLLLLLGCSGGDGVGAPSLLLVTLDTLRADHVGAYADGVSLTPSLDRLAAEGLVHDHAFTTMPTTGPAHLSLFTGLHPSQHGSRSNGVPLSLSQVSRDLAARLAAHGYATAAVTTTSFLSRRALGLHGFGFFDAPGGEGGDGNQIRAGARAVDVALGWLRQETRRPVLLWVHLYDPHAPYGDAAEKLRSLPLDPETYGWVDRPRFTAAERARMARLYAEGVRDMDAALGRLVAGVRGLVRGPLLIVAVSDHGESLDERLEERGYAYDHGEFLDAEVVRIPLLLAGAGVGPGRSAGAVSLRDLYTTLLAAAGVGDPDAVREGRRDLRRPSAARRIVRVERRSFGSPVREQVRAHALAATDGERTLIVAEDGERTLIVAEDGSVSAGSAERDADLAAALDPRIPSGTSPPVQRVPHVPPDAATREALEALGYAE